MRATLVLVAFGVLAGCGAATPIDAVQADSVPIDATPVPLRSGRPESLEIGALEYRGGLELSCTLTWKL